MDRDFDGQIENAIEERVGERPQGRDLRGDWERIGNTRFAATDGIGGGVRIRHEGDIDLSVRMTPKSVKVRSRESDMDIEVDHEGTEPRPGTMPQAADVGTDPEVTFEADRMDEPSGVMKVWELGDHRAELRFLRQADGDPRPSPWHVKVVGPDYLAGGRVDAVWSSSYRDREMAESKATERLETYNRRSQRRKDKYE